MNTETEDTTTKTNKLKSFKNLLSTETYNSIKSLGFKKLTNIQSEAIPHLLKHEDVIGIAKTGSGKTLAFLIPLIENLIKAKFKLEDGTGAIIITPTRELAIQINEVLTSILTQNTLNITHGLLIGGVNRKKECDLLSQGLLIVVATPGRLLDHMQTTRNFKYKKLNCLVIDEVDRMFDYGFEEDMKTILNLLPEKRQTMMFSATKTDKVQVLIDLAMRSNPIYLGVDDNKETSTVSGLEQFYTICPTGKRLLFLHYTLLKKLRNKKVIVFYSSRNSVEFHYKFFTLIDNESCFMALHGKMDQHVRTKIYFKFCIADKAVLFCTDVAARGLDIPEVDVILQYDPPRNAQEYIHRVGRTGRGEGKIGRGLLVLRPEEISFVGHLKGMKVPLEEYEIPWDKIKCDRQEIIENVVQGDEELKKLGKEGFTSFMRAYSLHVMRDIFDIYSFDMRQVGKSFGFDEPPLVDLNLNVKKRKRHLNRILESDNFG